MNKTLSRASLLDAMDRAAIELNHVDDYADAVRADYSGRSMYGGQCAAVVLDRQVDCMGLIGALAVTILLESDEGDGEAEALALAADARTDSMGMGVVLYWPGWTLAD